MVEREQVPEQVPKQVLEVQEVTESGISEKTAKLEAAMRQLDEKMAQINAQRAMMAAEALDRTVSGVAEAGVPKKEETPKEYMQRVLRGDV